MNNMKQLLLIFFASMLIMACGGPKSDEGSSGKTSKPIVDKTTMDDGKGVGETKNVVLNDPLNEDMISNGQAIYDMKCAACHKMSEKRLVGPGFAGVTNKREPEWIMNMITNVDIMLDEDPEAQKLFEECLTRMPNQNVKVEDARDILEFLLKNDSE